MATKEKTTCSFASQSAFQAYPPSERPQVQEDRESEQAEECGETSRIDYLCLRRLDWQCLTRHPT